MPINKGNNDGLDVFTAMSICTGYDGIGLGLKQVIPNLRTICYVEREAYPIANLVSKIKQDKMDDAPIWDDLATFDGRPFKGMVDVFHGGIPCQPWSCAGKQKGIEDERWIWDDVKRIISEIEPECIFLEEVPGFVRGGGLGYVLSDLAKMGFNAEWGCFSAAEVGAPHKRERLFIMGYYNSQRQYEQSIPVWQGQKEDIEADRTGETMANTSHERLQGLRKCGGQKGWQTQAGHIGSSRELWPARQGEPQYDWEEQRTVKSEVGLSANGNSSVLVERLQLNKAAWVDEIRMCGNGVVPDCAAKAWVTLWERLSETKPIQGSLFQ